MSETEELVDPTADIAAHLLGDDDTPAPTPEDVPEATPEGEAPPEDSLEALREELEAARAASAAKDEEIKRLDRHQRGLYEEVRSQRETLKRMDEIEQLLKQRLEGAPAEEDAVPDPDTQPAAYAAWKADETGKKLDNLLTEQKKAEDTRSQEQKVRALQDWMGATEKDFEARHPEYEAAEEHWASVTARNLRMMYPSLSDKEVETQLVQAEIALALTARQQNRTMPELKMELAKSYGWAPPQTVEPEAGAEEAAEAEDEPLPPPSGPRTRRNQRAKTLEVLGGGGQARGGRAKLSTKIDKMSQAEYEAFKDDLVAQLGSEHAATRYIEETIAAEGR